MADQPHADGVANAGQEPGNDEYEVGYKKPPLQTRFQPGRSGNPKGRPRGRKSFSTEIREVLDMKIPVVENGRKAKVSARHAMLLRLRQLALAGDQRAIDKLLVYAMALDPAESATDVAKLLDEDRLILEAFDSRGAEDDDAGR